MGLAALQLVPQLRKKSSLTELNLSVLEYLAAKRQEGLSTATLDKYREHFKKVGKLVG